MKLIVGNQKSYLNNYQLDRFIDKSKNIKANNVIICPSSIYLDRFKNTRFLLGSQNVSNYNSGSSTGEISAEQLKSIGVDFSIVGHSERRQKQQETIEDTNIKIKRLLEQNITPILCVGELKVERENNTYKDVILSQLEGALKNFSTTSVEKIIIAYEPLWAIGTGILPSNEEIREMAKYIKEVINNNYGCDIKILYGGSINKHNISILKEIKAIDGYLIGKASTNIDELKAIIETVNN